MTRDPNDLMRDVLLAETEVRQKRGRNSKARGKVDERDIARRMGGTRYKADSGGGCDIEHETYVIQVKGGSTVTTAAIRDGMAAAKAAAIGSTKLPCVALLDRRGTRNQRYLVFELDAFCAFHGLGAGE